MRTSRSFRLWLSTLIGVLLGLLFLVLTPLVREEGGLLDFTRCLHYPSNQFMLAWDHVFSIESYRGSILVEGLAFVIQWALLGLCVGWLFTKMSHDKKSG